MAANTRKCVEEPAEKPFDEGEMARSPCSLILDYVNYHPNLALHFSAAERCTFPPPLAVDGVSDYHMALEVSGACPGLGIAVATETWSVVGGGDGPVAVGFGPWCEPEAVSKSNPWTKKAEIAPHPIPRGQARRHFTTTQ